MNIQSAHKSGKRIRRKVWAELGKTFWITLDANDPYCLSLADIMAEDWEVEPEHIITIVKDDYYKAVDVVLQKLSLQRDNYMPNMLVGDFIEHLRKELGL